jgi:isoquinoline 1-oxidoreductase subunit beta
MTHNAGYDTQDFLLDHEAAATGRTPHYLRIAKLDRRGFLKLTGIAGGGLMLGFALTPVPIAHARSRTAAGFAPNGYVTIDKSGIVIYAPNPEIGQGVKTSLPMIVAEELDAAWQDVRVEQAIIDNALYGAQVAGGSRSIPTSWDPLRRAGAVARAMLVMAAARQWQVDAAECSTADSRVVHTASGRSIGYVEIADEAAQVPVPDPDSVALKKPSRYRLLGSRIGGVDNRALVTGKPLFGIDQTLPGMRYAVYQKCPAYGGRVAAANLDEIKKLPGVVDAFVLSGNGKFGELAPGVAIVAQTTWAALQAKRQLKVTWDEATAAKDSWSTVVDAAARALNTPGKEVVVNKGSVATAFESGATVTAYYSYQFVSHAQLEPQNCTAWYRNGRIELWAPTQTPQRGAATVAAVLGLAPDKVTVHQTRAGGGFGRRLANDYMCEAAAIAARARVPVKLQWSREDDMTHDFYRAGGFHALKGSFDQAGRLAAWQQHFVTFARDGKPVSGGSMSDQIFPSPLLPNYRLTQTLLNWDTPCGPWRAPGSNVYGFVVQSFLHEMAVAANRDHVEFLLEVLGPPRWLEPGNAWSLNTGRAAAVVKLAAAKAGWGQPMPAGRALGLAFYFSHAGHIAEVADVSVSPDKKIKVHRVTVAADVGPIVNRSMAENQCQGAVVDGLSTMLGLKVTFDDGRAQQQNFDQYPILRMPHTPAVDVHFMDSDYAPTGLGEPALPPLAAAVCNAIFTASGHRIRTLPIADEGFSV